MASKLAGSVPANGQGLGIERASSTTPRHAATPNLSYYLRLFVLLRWCAVVCTGLAIAALQYVAEARAPFAALYVVVAVVVGYNGLFYLYHRRPRIEHPPGVRALAQGRQDCVHGRIALLQIGLDLGALFLLLHFSGGVENPAVFFFIFHVVAAAILLRPAFALAVAALASALILGLGLAEGTGWLVHYHPSWVFGTVELIHSTAFVVGVATTLSLTLLIVALFGTLLMRELRRRREQIAALTDLLRGQNEELQRLEEGRRRLLAVASHELQSPIAAVASHLMTLRGGYLGETTNRQQAVLQRCLGRLEGLRTFVSEVLNWTALGARQGDRGWRPVDIRPVAERVVEYHRERAEAKSIELALHCESLELPLVDATPERLTQILENLVSNALKYTPEGGRVAVELSVTTAGRLRVGVRDNGIGISEEDQGRIFEGFFRAAAVKGAYKGSGLGLSIVKGIVEAHGGTVAVHSVLGQGTSFVLELPSSRKAGGGPDYS